MSDPGKTGVLYTDYSRLAARSGLASLWSYETRVREVGRRSVSLTPRGDHEYWLDRSDPLLNTILPGTHVSLVVNLGDVWATGRSLATSAIVPRISIIGPATTPRILLVGTHISAIGAVVSPTEALGMLGVPASELVDRIVPLEDLWTRAEVESLLEKLCRLDRAHAMWVLGDELTYRVGGTAPKATVGEVAARLIRLHGGRVSIHDMARCQGLSRREFGRRFHDTAGLSPKLFARITRFQALVSALLSTDVARWASLPSEMGFYDQAHMINEFRAFAGSPPTTFFRPHGVVMQPGEVVLRGRPSEWMSA